MESLERQKVSYWETRTINIGNYEKIESGLSIAHSVIEPLSGYGDKTVVINESAAVSTSDISNTGKAVNFVMQAVKKKLDQREKEIRLQTAGWEGMDFDSEKKLVSNGIIKESEYTGQYNKRMEVDIEDDATIEDENDPDNDLFDDHK